MKLQKRLSREPVVGLRLKVGIFEPELRMLNTGMFADNDDNVDAFYIRYEILFLLCNSVGDMIPSPVC